MNLYDITKGQLITIWIFAMLYWLIVLGHVMDAYEPSYVFVLQVFLIPGVLVFITLGWRKRRNKPE